MKKSSRITTCILTYLLFLKKACPSLQLVPVLLFLLIFTKPATAQNEPLKLKLKNVSLLAAMDSIRQHSGYRFSYSLDLVPLLQQTRVSISSAGDRIEKVLTQLLAGTGIKYLVKDNMVLLSKSKDPRPEKTSPAPLMQTVKGKVVDKESHAPLTGISITVMNEPVARGTITDSNGLFSLQIPVGRQSLHCTHVGYQEYIADNIMVISGKETFLTIEMQEAAEKMQAVIVNAAERRDHPLNSMAIVSTRMLTPEDASRYAGGYNDPARMVTAFAGVMSGGDGRNNMIIRGNSPSGILWKLEGVEIPNPNHFSQGQGDGGGIFNIVSGDLLADFDFFTSAFPAEYGNALSGILDLNMRKGNPDKTEYGLQVGMIGSQVSIEGPISKKQKSSWLFNYRYGNLQFLNNTGIIDLDENQKPPVFQDFNLHINLPTRKAGNFSIFGIGGISSTGKNSFKDSMSWTRNPDLRFEETESHQMGVLGLKHTILSNNKKNYLRSVLAVSWKSDRLVRSGLNKDYQPIPNDSSRYSYPTIRFSTTLNHKISATNVIRAGVIYSQLFFSVFGMRNQQNNGYYPHVDERGNTGLVEGFFQWKYRLLRRLEINTGIHATSFLLNHDYAIEPRFGAKWRTGSNSFFSYGFGLHSKIEPISLYFAKVAKPGGAFVQPNLSLKMTRAMHHVLGYDLSLSKNLRVKIEAYHQYLYKVPVIDDTSNVFSVLNNLRGIADTTYVNKGKGYNKGIELTIEKFFSENYYFLLGGTLFDSKYRPANGKQYNTYYNTGYQVNGLAGKDFKIGKSKQHIFSVNAKASVHGGFRYSPGRLETNSSGMNYLSFPIEETYTGQTPTFVQFDASLRLRKNNRRYSWILSLDVQNLTNRENILDNTSRIDTRGNLRLDPTTDLGIIPILNLKVEF